MRRGCRLSLAGKQSTGLFSLLGSVGWSFWREDFLLPPGEKRLQNSFQRCTASHVEEGCQIPPPGGPLPARGSPAARPVPEGPARAVPSCAFCKRRRFGLCGGRVGAEPQRPAAFCKRRAKTFSPLRGGSTITTKIMPGTQRFAEYRAISLPIGGVVLSSTAFSRAGHSGHVCSTTRTFRGRKKNCSAPG